MLIAIIYLAAESLQNDMINAIPYVPKKITIGLSAWITFKVVNESEYNFV